MRTALHLLTIACLLWCALGLAERGDAHVAFGERAHVTNASLVDEASRTTPDAADRGDHHHCPVAPDLPAPSIAAPAPLATSRPIAAAAVPLPSLVRAPPLQPPAA